ncbi:MAG TPA: hypothetical protein VNZ01_01900 [Solirubrobacteraceae bacterium]|jgi:hypothetical protein|nr:hypothetical protein [Solirubrobacteraceae bacterium]
MSSRPRKFPLVAIALLAAVALGACGSSHTRVTTGTYAGVGGANAPYLDVGPLAYQVQISRQLNPADTEDSAYLEGLTPAQRQLLPGQEWFAVFLQVYNRTGSSHPAATSLTITDTQNNTYTPIVPDQTNPFAYRAGFVAAGSQLPVAQSVPSFGPTQGSLVLYKIQVASLDNRPFQFKIVDPTNPSLTGSAELDV